MDDSGYRVARVRYLSLSPSTGGSEAEVVTDAKATEALEAVPIATHKFYLGEYVLLHRKTKASELQDEISTSMLNMKVNMTEFRVSKEATHNIKTARIFVKDICKAAAWARRFDDESLVEDDDEIPFSNNAICMAKQSGQLQSAGGSSEQLKERVCA